MTTVFRGQRSTYSLRQDKPIANGRLAAVFLAEDDASKRAVALKCFRGYPEQAASLKAYYREIQNLSEMRHPNILEILDYSSDPGADDAFLALPYMEGGNLRRLLRGRSFCPPETAFALLSQAATALDYAHTCGFIHGDIKPENILMDAQGHAYLADFGVARHFDTDDAVMVSRQNMASNDGIGGTSAYLSPEQLEDNVSAPSADLYAFALVAFELLAGRLPFDARAPLYKQLHARVKGELLDARAVNPLLSEEIASTLARALSPDRALRPPSAAALMRRLQRGSSWDVFLAHAGADVAAAERLYALLNPKVRVFLDSKRLEPGDNWDQKLLQAQRTSLITVVLVSSSSEDAYYQREEIAAAIRLSREDPKAHRVIPVYLDAAVTKNPPYGMNIRHGLAITDEASWRAVADELASLVEKKLAER